MASAGVGYLGWVRCAVSFEVPRPFPGRRGLARFAPLASSRTVFAGQIPMKTPGFRAVGGSPFAALVGVDQGNLRAHYDNPGQQRIFQRPATSIKAGK